jgi:hypothetical protein
MLKRIFTLAHIEVYLFKVSGVKYAPNHLD